MRGAWEGDGGMDPRDLEVGQKFRFMPGGEGKICEALHVHTSTGVVVYQRRVGSQAIKKIQSNRVYPLALRPGEKVNFNTFVFYKGESLILRDTGCDLYNGRGDLMVMLDTRPGSFLKAVPASEPLEIIREFDNDKL